MCRGCCAKIERKVKWIYIYLNISTLSSYFLTVETELKKGYLGAQLIRNPLKCLITKSKRNYSCWTWIPKVTSGIFLYQQVSFSILLKQPTEEPLNHDIPSLHQNSKKRKKLEVMDKRYSSVSDNRSYEDFDPICKWRTEEGRDILEVHLPGLLSASIIMVLLLYMCVHNAHSILINNITLHQLINIRLTGFFKKTILRKLNKLLIY